MTTEVNQICDLTKQISVVLNQSDNEESIKNLSLKLNEIISSIFEKGNAHIIEEAVVKIKSENNTTSSDILNEEIDFEIENILYEDENGKEFDSSMFLMPCLAVSHSNNFTVPSINDFERIVQKALFEKNIISEKSSFKLGTIRLTPEDIEFMNLQNWWDVHRDIIDEEEADEETKLENKKMRDMVINYEPEGIVSLFYFIATIVSPENNAPVCDALFDTEMDADFWSTITDSISGDDVKFTLLPPMPIKESIENAKVISEMVSFELFFEAGIADGSEIAYSKINEDQYVVLFFDETTQFLNRFYLYDTNKDNEGFICHIVDLCLKYNDIPLYYLEYPIKMQELENWKEIEDIIDISKHLEKKNRIDLIQTQKFCSFNNLENISNHTIH